jgi:alkanesulfonate monooxygenase SsuD/methylene tetrahydromethanopterin reductase-like flavin-dependent oxidoreductase (luciferase family)
VSVRSSLGVVIPQHDAGPEELIGAAKLAEASGLDSVWVADHLWGRNAPERGILEAWSSLAAVAAATESIIVGTLVTRVGLRAPRVLQAMAETVSKVSPGRLYVGLGLGDGSVAAEQEAFGVAQLPLEIRRVELEATVDILRKNVPEVPLFIGGHSDEAKRIAIRAGGWNFWGPPSDLAGHMAELDELATGASPITSWGGNMPDAEGWRHLEEAGPDMVMVAAGAANYPERIARLVDLRQR